MSTYAQLSDALQYLPDVTDASDQATLQAILERASRAIDSYLNVAPDYFAAVSPPPVERNFRGTGTAYLPVPPLFDLQSVKVSGGSITDYDYDPTNGYLIRRWPSRWPYMSEITITARFGFAAVPADITEACLQIAVRWWRGRDEAFSGVIGGINRDGQIIERGLPASARTILDAWTQRRSVVFV